MVQAKHLDPNVIRVLETSYDEIVEPTLYQQKISAEQFAVHKEENLSISLISDCNLGV